MRICRFCALLFIAFLINGAIPFSTIFVTHYAYAADEGWKDEFEQVCSQTDNAMNMGIEELAKLLERCDRLRPQIEQLEATPRKIYLKRLQMCCNLFTYVLESKKKAAKQ